MKAAEKKVLDAALQLPAAARAALAAHLIDSLDREVDEDAEQQWRAEIERRVHDLDAGTVRAVPWSRARRTIVGRARASTRS